MELCKFGFKYVELQISSVDRPFLSFMTDCEKKEKKSSMSDKLRLKLTLNTRCRLHVECERLTLLFGITINKSG